MNFINKKYKIILFLIGIIMLIIYLFPVYWIVISSLKDLGEIMKFPPTIVPNKLQLINYTKVFESDVIIHLKNSIFIGFFTTLITILLGVCAGYSLSRINKWWSALILFIFLIGQMLPSVLIITPLFLMFKKIGINNSYIAVILGKTAVSLPLAVIMLRTTFLSVPNELEEAALIDGSNRIEAFLKITLPIAKMGIFVISAITFLFAYGDFIFSLSFLNELYKQPVTVGLYTFIGANVTKWNEVMAYTNIIIIPVIILFIVLQDKIIHGQFEGALK